MIDARDMALEALADSEAALVEQIGELRADRDAYRAVAQQAIHALHALTVECHRLRARHSRLIDEYRYLRTQTIRQAAVT